VSNASENTNLLRLVDVEKKLGRAKVLKGVNLEIRQGERMVIIGRSGGGKSVLLKHIIGLMRPDSGQVWFRDQDLSQLNEEQLVPLRKETGMLFQNGALFDSLTVGENVAFPLREKGNRDEEAIRSEVARALKIVDLPVVADSINKLMVRLGQELEMTSVIVTHDMVSAQEVGDRIAFLKDGRIYAVDRPEVLLESQDPNIYRFVKGISDATDEVF
jgi:phospholipid/cholesterol/gamma-HCH transport system ATP-binding protein